MIIATGPGISQIVEQGYTVEDCYLHNQVVIYINFIMMYYITYHPFWFYCDGNCLQGPRMNNEDRSLAKTDGCASPPMDAANAPAHLMAIA